MTLHPEVTISLLPGGFLVHTARQEEDEVVQDPHIFPTLEGAVTHALTYFEKSSTRGRKLEDHVI